MVTDNPISYMGPALSPPGNTCSRVAAENLSTCWTDAHSGTHHCVPDKRAEQEDENIISLHASQRARTHTDKDDEKQVQGPGN